MLVRRGRAFHQPSGPSCIHQPLLSGVPSRSIKSPEDQSGGVAEMAEGRHFKKIVENFGTNLPPRPLKSTFRGWRPPHRSRRFLRKMRHPRSAQPSHCSLAEALNDCEKTHRHMQPLSAILRTCRPRKRYPCILIHPAFFPSNRHPGESTFPVATVSRWNRTFTGCK